MEISAEKTKLMTTPVASTQIKVNGQKLETVTSFKYLGSVIIDECCKPEILPRIAQTTAALTRLKPVLNDRSISHTSILRLMRSLVTSIFLYACETWTHSRAPKKNTSHGNEVLPQDTMHLIQRPCCQRGSPCHDPAGNRTTRRPPDHRKEAQTAVVWTCLPFIRSGQDHIARHSERGKKTRLKMDRPGVRQVPEGSGEQEKMEKTGCKIICGAPTTLAVKG